jgi:hypothetical protein
MAERLPSDHADVVTHRAHLVRSGGTRRPALRPAEALPSLAAADGAVVRLVVDGTTRHARVSVDADGPLLRGAYDNRRLARTPGEGEDRLAAWADAVGRGPGDAVDLDEVVAGDLYGVREPGTRAVYEASRGPADSLSSIARSLEDG